MVNQCEVRDAGEICELPLHTGTCPASLCAGKKQWTNNEPQSWNMLPKHHSAALSAAISERHLSHFYILISNKSFFYIAV